MRRPGPPRLRPRGTCPHESSISSKEDPSPDRTGVIRFRRVGGANEISSGLLPPPGPRQPDEGWPFRGRPRLASTFRLAEPAGRIAATAENGERAALKWGSLPISAGLELRSVSVAGSPPVPTQGGAQPRPLGPRSGANLPMSNRLRAFRRRAGPPSSGSQGRSSPTALDFVFDSLQGRALPGSLHRPCERAAAPASLPVDRDIGRLRPVPTLRNLGQVVTGLVEGVTAWLRRWRERAQSRQHLSELSDHMLKDLGLSRAQVENETANSFWRE
jgi:uncharacterized protein YjiS (DUF1127 family)